MQGTSKEAAIVRFSPLSMRMGMAGISKLRADVTSRECKLGDCQVTNVVEFYIPSTFRTPVKVTSPQGRGKLIEFRPSTKKSA